MSDNEDSKQENYQKCVYKYNEFANKNLIDCLHREDFKGMKTSLIISNKFEDN